MELTFEAIAEDSPGPKWRALFDRFWPAYERWFLSDGDHARPRSQILIVLPEQVEGVEVPRHR